MVLALNRKRQDCFRMTCGLWGNDETNSGPQAGEQKGREWGMDKKEAGEVKGKMGVPSCST